jgi:type II secretory pathway component PulL
MKIVGVPSVTSLVSDTATKSKMNMLSGNTQRHKKSIDVQGFLVEARAIEVKPP